MRAIIEENCAERGGVGAILYYPGFLCRVFFMFVIGSDGKRQNLDTTVS